MIYLLYIALAYLALTTFVLVWNRKEFSPLLSTKNYVPPSTTPKVSICIPVRNEERSIGRCVQSALDQRYPELEVLVLNDRSTDRTAEIVRALEEKYPDMLLVIEGDPKPEGWLGKSWACHQLARRADGGILMFLDADTWLKPDTVRRIVRTMGHDVLDFLTVWPQQKLDTFWEQTIVPLVYYLLLTLLPTAYVQKLPRWLPNILRKKTDHLFAAACGQAMVFKRAVYRAVGGHEAVKKEVVEDVALARRIKRNGFSMNIYHGIAAIHCRMYTSLEEIEKGFRKNFLAGFNYNIPLFVFAGLLHLIVFILPLFILIFALSAGQTQYVIWSIAVILLFVMHRMLIAYWFDWKVRYSFLHPLGVAWFLLLGLRVLQDYYHERSATWKGRKIGNGR